MLSIPFFFSSHYQTFLSREAQSVDCVRFDLMKCCFLEEILSAGVFKRIKLLLYKLILFIHLIYKKNLIVSNIDQSSTTIKDSGKRFILEGKRDKAFRQEKNGIQKCGKWVPIPRDVMSSNMSDW